MAGQISGNDFSGLRTILKVINDKLGLDKLGFALERRELRKVRTDADGRIKLRRKMKVRVFFSQRRFPLLHARYRAKEETSPERLCTRLAAFYSSSRYYLTTVVTSFLGSSLSSVHSVVIARGRVKQRSVQSININDYRIRCEREKGEMERHAFAAVIVGSRKSSQNGNERGTVYAR